MHIAYVPRTNDALLFTKKLLFIFIFVWDGVLVCLYDGVFIDNKQTHSKTLTACNDAVNITDTLRRALAWQMETA